MEIIFSDDNSTDKTFEIMKYYADSYNGDKIIRLNKNAKNLGVTSHVNKVMEMANGEIIVNAAGDDISLPDRTREVIDHFINNGRNDFGVFSNLSKINNQGLMLGEMFKEQPRFSKNIFDFKKKKECWALGASFAFRKSIHEKYGAINGKIRQEDGVLAFRCLLEGGVGYINKPLVQYRLHDSNVSQTDDPRRRLFLQSKEYLLKASWLNDAKKSGIRDSKLIALVRNEYRISCLRSMFFSTPILGYSFNYVRVGIKNFINKHIRSRGL